MSWNVFQANSAQADRMIGYLKEGTIRRWLALRAAEFVVCDRTEIFLNIRVSPCKVMHFHARVFGEEVRWVCLEFRNSMTNQRYDVHSVTSGLSPEFTSWRDKIVEFMAEKHSKWLAGSGV